MTTPKPAGTTMEGMIWNANHVLDLALHPGTKKSGDILKEAKGVMILNTVDVGIVFAGTRGSGVVLAKNADGEWSAPSAVTLTSLKLGWIIGAQDKGLLIVFTEDNALNNFLSGSSIEIGGGVQIAGDTVDDRDTSAPGVNSYLTNKGAGSVYVYTYKIPPSFEGVSLDAVTMKHKTKVNERFYRVAATPEQIVREGKVTIPEGSGIPDLHKKLAALEAGKDVELTPEEKQKKEEQRKEAEDSAHSVHAEINDEIEHVKGDEVKGSTADAKVGGEVKVSTTSNAEVGDEIEITNAPSQ